VEYGHHLPQGWEDYDLWLKLALAKQSGKFIPLTLSDYRVHGQSMLQKMISHQDRLAVHFTKKFLPLVAEHNELPVLFGFPRSDLLMVCAEGEGWGMPFSFQKKPTRFVHRVLGKKLSRSLFKRVSELYCWLHP
jgi:hypothetical protein